MLLFFPMLLPSFEIGDILTWDTHKSISIPAHLPLLARSSFLQVLVLQAPQLELLEISSEQILDSTTVSKFVDILAELTNTEY